MKNPKTTILGYITLLTSLLTLVTHLLQGNFSMIGQDLPLIMSGLAGIGLVVASDGGH